MNLDRGDRWYIAGAAFGLLFFVNQVFRISAAEKNPNPAHFPRTTKPFPTRFPVGTDQFLIDAAAKAGIEQLDAVEIRGTTREQVRAEWRSETRSAMALIASLESRGTKILRVHVSPSSQGVKWILSGDPAAPLKEAIQPAVLNYDPFMVVKPQAKPAPVVSNRVRPKEGIAVRKMREESERAAALALAETQRLEQRRQEISANVRVSATMNNGRDPLALADVTESGRHRTMTLHRGDVVLGANVASIDDHGGSVSFDIDGKAQVVVRVPASGTP